MVALPLQGSCKSQRACLAACHQPVGGVTSSGILPCPEWRSKYSLRPRGPGQQRLMAQQRAGGVVRAAVAAPEAPAATSTAPDTKSLYMPLQNGSDVRGVAVEGVPGEKQTLNATVAYFMGCGLAEQLAQRQGVSPQSLRVSIGRDPRISGPLLAAALAAGLTSKGVTVARFGYATTPAMFMSTIIQGYEYDAAVMITASHLPYNRNGFKFFTKEGGYEKKDISKLLTLAAQEHDAENAPNTAADARYRDEAFVLSSALHSEPGLIEQVDFMPVYSAHLRDIIKKGIDHPDHYEQPLKGFKIIVDAGNGSGGFLASDVLAPLGADTSGSQFLDPDGWFPNHVPNPEDKEAMIAGVRAVNTSRADLGIVVDTDVDRSAVVAGNGTPINSNRYIALMSYITLRKYPGTTIVTDSVTSNGLTEFIDSLGGKHFRYKRGYKNVIGKGVELNGEGVQTELMMETSGHGAMKENYYLDDGTYSASQIVIIMVKRALEGLGKDIYSSLLKDLKEPMESSEFRLKLKGDNFKEDGQKILADFHSWVQGGASGAEGWNLEKENHEGWRVSIEEGEGKRGWALLRASLHDPLLVLNVESDVRGGSCEIVRQVVSFFEENADESTVDSSKLYQGCSIEMVRH
ncbi:g6994 [Coccomyxa viridis]|uniref:phosphoglucomutase (alpha-D-glucose-1,6-bisphosphate-dependent) n=1 Tax=Coccomyxa viridis TaxID=1274662 RepID=A0ABP1G0Q6_9CHLO